MQKRRGTNENQLLMLRSQPHSMHDGVTKQHAWQGDNAACITGVTKQHAWQSDKAACITGVTKQHA